MARDWDGQWTKMILPGIGACIVGAANAGAYVRIVISTGTTGTLLIPVGFDPPTAMLEMLGSGGLGGAASGGFGGGGGAGGQYWGLTTGISLTVGSTYNYQRGVPGATVTQGSPGSPISCDTWFGSASTLSYAQGGLSVSGANGVPGGNYATPVGGGTTHNGGTGSPQAFAFTTGRGAGASAGPHGNGAIGGDGAGGTTGGPGGGGGDNGFAGTSAIAGNTNGQQGGNNRLGLGGGSSVLSGVSGSDGVDGGGAAGGGANARGGSGGVSDLWDGYGPSGGGAGAGSGGFAGGDGKWGAGGGGTSQGSTTSGTSWGGLITLRWIP
jgi:hypothetical protein